MALCDFQWHYFKLLRWKSVHYLRELGVNRIEGHVNNIVGGRVEVAIDLVRDIRVKVVRLSSPQPLKELCSATVIKLFIKQPRIILTRCDEGKVRMEVSWEEVMGDEQWEKVFEALEEPEVKRIRVEEEAMESAWEMISENWK
jgi:hypothetical protein